jgi:exonuclease-1
MAVTIPNRPFVKYCLKRVNLLRQHDITPIMVFDGGYLPTKAHTEKERRQ